MAVSMRATLEAKLVRTTRWGWSAINLVRLSRTSASEPEVPGDSTLVLSHRMASTPSLPNVSSASTSVRAPTRGAGSSFQSPVCSRRPNSVSSTNALASGIECVTWTKRQAMPPSLNSWPGSTTRIGTSRAKSVSASLARSTAAVNGVHQIGQPSRGHR